jgi:glycosyltransferase involved in cell wall biosynthesis
MRKSR